MKMCRSSVVFQGLLEICGHFSHIEQRVRAFIFSNALVALFSWFIFNLGLV